MWCKDCNVMHTVRAAIKVAVAGASGYAGGVLRTPPRTSLVPLGCIEIESYGGVQRRPDAGSAPSAPAAVGGPGSSETSAVSRCPVMTWWSSAFPHGHPGGDRRTARAGRAGDRSRADFRSTDAGDWEASTLPARGYVAVRAARRSPGAREALRNDPAWSLSRAVFRRGDPGAVPGSGQGARRCVEHHDRLGDRGILAQRKRPRCPCSRPRHGPDQGVRSPPTVTPRRSRRTSGW